MKQAYHFIGLSIDSVIFICITSGYKNVIGKTQTEVKSKLKSAIENSQKLDVIKSGKYTVGQWMDVWYENYATLKVRGSSHQTYKGYIENHIKPTPSNIIIPLVPYCSLKFCAT